MVWDNCCVYNHCCDNYYCDDLGDKHNNMAKKDIGFAKAILQRFVRFVQSLCVSVGLRGSDPVYFSLVKENASEIFLL